MHRHGTVKKWCDGHQHHGIAGLRDRPIGQQNSVLGPQRAKLWRDGRLTFSEMFNSSGESMTIREIPHNLTLQKPLDTEKEGFTNYFNVVADGWELVPDLRGKIYYKKESGEPFAINDLGLLSDDLTDKEKPDQMHKWDNNKNDWVLDKSLKQNFITGQNTDQKNVLKADAEERITLLERKVKLKRATEQDLAILDLLYSFTLDLDDLDLIVFPEIPS